MQAEINFCKEERQQRKAFAKRFRQLQKETGNRGYGIYWSREMRALSVLKQKIEDLEDQLIARRRGDRAGF